MLIIKLLDKLINSFNITSVGILYLIIIGYV